MKPVTLLLFILLLPALAKAQIVGFSINASKTGINDTITCKVDGVIMGAGNWQPYDSIKVKLASKQEEYIVPFDSTARFKLQGIGYGTYIITIIYKNKKYGVDQKLILKPGEIWEVELEAVLKE